MSGGVEQPKPVTKFVEALAALGFHRYVSNLRMDEEKKKKLKYSLINICGQAIFGAILVGAAYLWEEHFKLPFDLFLLIFICLLCFIALTFSLFKFKSWSPDMRSISVCVCILGIGGVILLGGNYFFDIGFSGLDAVLLIIIAFSPLYYRQWKNR